MSPVGKIQNLLAPGIINSLTRLVLVNAIYFKGNWANRFLKDRTMERPFKISKVIVNITFIKLFTICQNVAEFKKDMLSLHS